MKKNILLIGCLVVTASCGKYSKLTESPQKDIKEENPRIYGQVGGPALQSKLTYATPTDAVDKSANLKSLMFGDKKSQTIPVSQDISPKNTNETAPGDSAAIK